MSDRTTESPTAPIRHALEARRMPPDTMQTMIQSTCAQENGCVRQASSAPVSANGSANTEWLNRTNDR